MCRICAAADVAAFTFSGPANRKCLAGPGYTRETRAT
jgi:hypothetical protein